MIFYLFCLVHWFIDLGDYQIKLSLMEVMCVFLYTKGGLSGSQSGGSHLSLWLHTRRLVLEHICLQVTITLTELLTH